jgi:site-specific recombinase XerD
LRGAGQADPFAIMKAMGLADIKTTMIYVSLGKSHIRDQVERLNGVCATAGKR